MTYAATNKYSALAISVADKSKGLTRTAATTRMIARELVRHAPKSAPAIANANATKETKIAGVNAAALGTRASAARVRLMEAIQIAARFFFIPSDT